MSDVTILKSLLVTQLSVSLWSGRKKLGASDLGDAELPPAELASLGSKKIADPATLKIFATLKSRAVAMLDRVGVRFIGGWAIPENKASDVTTALVAIRDQFEKEKADFLADYDDAIQKWITDPKHSSWAGIHLGIQHPLTPQSDLR